MTRFAYNLTRREVHYRHDVFTRGLAAAGFEVRTEVPATGRPGDLALIWNRYSFSHDVATRFEAGGGTVVVAENGFLGGRHDGGDRYALALGAHNGAGRWPSTGRNRFAALGVDLRPWRASGDHVLVCPNRAFGMPGLAMPGDWHARARDRLSRLTKRPIRTRYHPETKKPERSLAEDLAGAWCVVLWASSVGVRSLVEGVPVLADSPWWILKGIAGRLEEVEDPPMPERLPAFERLADAQWSLAEIATGEPFRELLSIARG